MRKRDWPKVGAKLLAVLGWTVLMVAGLFCAWLPTYLRPRSGVVRRAKARRRALRAWGLGMLRVIGVRLSVEGKAPPEGILVVSNHLGYLDIPVLGSVVPMVFVAKAELRRWPFWGFVAKVGGTIFVDRATKRDVLRVRREMREALARGDRVLVFPEATSTGGEAILPFKPALLADAAAMEAPVHWLTVSYTAPLDAPPARYSVAWGSDISFLRHLLGLFAMGRANCTVRFGDTPVRSGDRKELAVELRRAMLTRFEAVAGWEEQAAALIERAWRTRHEALRSSASDTVTARVAARVEGDLLRACEVCRRTGSQRQLSVALGKLGHVALDAGRTDEALARFEQAVAAARETDDPLRVAHAARHLGQVHHRQGRTDEAARWYSEALDLYGAAADASPLDHANALRPLAMLREECGDTAEAKVLWRRAARLYRDAGVAEGVEECEAHIESL